MAPLLIICSTLLLLTNATQIWIKYISNDGSDTADPSKTCTFSINGCGSSLTETQYLNEHTSYDGKEYNPGSDDNCEVSLDSTDGNCGDGDLLVTKYKHSGHTKSEFWCRNDNQDCAQTCESGAAFEWTDFDHHEYTCGGTLDDGHEFRLYYSLTVCECVRVEMDHCTDEFGSEYHLVRTHNCDSSVGSSEGQLQSESVSYSSDESNDNALVNERNAYEEEGWSKKRSYIAMPVASIIGICIGALLVICIMFVWGYYYEENRKKLGRVEIIIKRDCDGDEEIKLYSL